MDENLPVDDLDTGSMSGEVCYHGLSVPCLCGRIALQFLGEKSSVKTVSDGKSQRQARAKNAQKMPKIAGR